MVGGLLALHLTSAGMASKGLRSSIYQATRNSIGSNTARIPRKPLFAIPVVISRICLIIN